MNFLSKLLGRTAEPVVEVVEAVSPQMFKVEVVDGPRLGMWVITDKGVGILSANNEVVLVKEDGTNKLVVEGDKAVPEKITVDTITQANIEDIPVSRRPNTGALYTLGYKHKEIV
jgi:hypothetical protein